MDILIVDDEKMFLQSMTVLVTQYVPGSRVRSAAGGLEAIEMIEKHVPQILLLDFSMPVMNGLSVAKHVKLYYPSVKIVILTNVSGTAMVLNLAKIVDGFMFKDSDDVELNECIKTVMRGEVYLCERAKTKVVTKINSFDKLATIQLEPREINVIKLIADGKTTKQIAIEMGVKETTINSYKEGLLKKTKTKNTPELVAFAFSNGLI